MMMKSNFNFSFSIDREHNICAEYPLEISGSADLYYNDFAKKENIGTSFATDQNCFRDA
jgi:hypothetical protein